MSKVPSPGLAGRLVVGGLLASGVCVLGGSVRP